MEQLAARLSELWRTLGPWQKGLLFGVPALLIVGAVAALALLVAVPPVRAPLFRDMELADAARVVEELQERNVDYTLENEGRDILVPAPQVYDLRLELAGLGLPQSEVGFELFDQSKLGITAQGLRIDYQRAVQGELKRTLEALDQVQMARVILQIAPETSFLDTDARSTASVALALKPGEWLSEAQVEGIKHLVSGSVSRLDPEDVAIIDSRGNPLTGREQTESEQMLAGMEIAELRHRLRQRLERSLENKIRQFLEEPYGAGNVTASVSLEMDFRVIRSQSEEYTPVVEDQGIESRVEEHRSRESSTSEEPGGVPGTTSNIPGYLGISTGEGEATESSEYDLIVDYLVNREVREEDLPPGTITRRSAAVAISTDTWDAGTKASVEGLVASAIGASVAAGDVIDVQAFEFSEEESVAVSAEYMALQRSRTIGRVAGWVLALVLVGAALFFLRSLVVAALPREAALALPPGLTEGLELPEGVTAEEFALRRLDELATTQQQKMRLEIARLIEKEPDRVVSLLRSWMLEDA